MMVVRIGLTRSAALVVGHIAGAVVETLAVVWILEEAVTEMCQFVCPLRRYLHISISIYYYLSNTRDTQIAQMLLLQMRCIIILQQIRGKTTLTCQNKNVK